MVDPCGIPGCRDEADLVYLGHPICNRHWNDYTKPEAPPDALRMALGIAERSPEADKEHAMSEQPSAPAEAGTKEETVKTKKSGKRKAAKKQATPSKPEKKASRKREPKEKVELRTLALRVTNEEFELVHKAAGPRNLTGFMKTAVLNAATKYLATK